MKTLLQRAADLLHKTYGTPRGEITEPGFVAEGALVARGLVDKHGTLMFTADGGRLAFPAGLGGAVTQITSSATGVTLNTLKGQITTVALTTAAGAEEVFTVTNNKVAAVDVPSVSTTYAGAGTPVVSTKKVAAGAFDIVITNLHASAALNAAVVVNFNVEKGAIA